VVELHDRPRCVQIPQDLLHGHLLDGLVDDVFYLLLAFVQIQAQQFGQRRFVVHDELYL